MTITLNAFCHLCLAIFFPRNRLILHSYEENFVSESHIQLGNLTKVSSLLRWTLIASSVRSRPALVHCAHEISSWWTPGLSRPIQRNPWHLSLRKLWGQDLIKILAKDLHLARFCSNSILLFSQLSFLFQMVRTTFASGKALGSSRYQIRCWKISDRINTVVYGTS